VVYLSFGSLTHPQILDILDEGYLRTVVSITMPEDLNMSPFFLADGDRREAPTALGLSSRDRADQNIRWA
jgi:hypothetical protein